MRQSALRCRLEWRRLEWQFLLTLSVGSLGCGAGSTWQNDYDTFLDLIKKRAQICPYPAVNPNEFRSVAPLEALQPLMVVPPKNTENVILSFVDDKNQPNGPVVQWKGAFRAFKPEGAFSLNSIVGPTFKNEVEFDLTTEYRSKESNANDSQGATVYHVVFVCDPDQASNWSQTRAGEQLEFSARLGQIYIDGAGRSEIGVQQHAVLLFNQVKPASDVAAQQGVSNSSKLAPPAPGT